VRAQFDLDPEFAHFSTFWLSSHPRKVRDAIDYHRRRLDQHPYLYVTENECRLEELASASIASLLGTTSDEIIVTHSTTEGLAILYGGLKLAKGEEVLSTSHDHYSTFSTLNLLSKRTGALVRRISLYDDGIPSDSESIVERVSDAIGNQTRLVALTWVHSSSGRRLPIERIAARIAHINSRRPVTRQVLLSVDATHALGVFDFDVSTLGCDFLVAACHKWLYGPRGTGFIWGKRTRLDEIAEVIPSFAPGPLGVFTGQVKDGSFGPAERLRPGGFNCFEHRWSIPAAVDFLSEIGTRRVYDRLSELTQNLVRAIQNIDRVRVITPSESAEHGAIVCFEVEGLAPSAVVSRLLERKVISSVSPYANPVARLTPGIYNSQEDVERAVHAVREVAATCVRK
jgi:isopenicillin-N epimerase